jgi:hypothetical protein
MVSRSTERRPRSTWESQDSESTDQTGHGGLAQAAAAPVEGDAPADRFGHEPDRGTARTEDPRSASEGRGRPPDVSSAG